MSKSRLFVITILIIIRQSKLYTNNIEKEFGE